MHRQFRVGVLPPTLQHYLYHSVAPPSLRRLHSAAPRAPRARLPRSLLLVVPAAGLAALYLLPHPPSLLPRVLQSPTLIPAPAPTPAPRLIRSPHEPRPALGARLLHLLRTHVLAPLLTARRFLYLCVLFLPVLAAAPMLLIGAPGSGEPRRRGDAARRRRRRPGGERWGAVWWYGFLVAQMQRAGPTFIKLAQWAASRADLFPDVLCDKMGMLHSSGAPHAFRHTRRVVERVFQRPFEEVFEEFEQTPIGTGAIAQVYRAKLCHDLLPPSYLDPKRPARALAAISPTPDPPPAVPTAYVAIKVLHPHVGHLIARDLSIISFFARVIALFPGMEWISLPEEVDVFGRMMHEQLDLRHEVHNLQRFEANFASRKAAVTFPRPLADYSTQDVLIEEYENALPLKAFLKHGGGPYEDIIAESGLDAFLKMLLLDNFVHSDLHPGNIMIKFYKPTTSFVLRGILASIFNTPPPPDPSHSRAHQDDQNAIVDRLRPLAADPPRWRAALAELFAAGYQPELVFIDAGLVTTLAGASRRNFLDLFRAVAEFDGYRAGQLMVARCRTPALAVDAETFALKMQRVVLGVKAKTFSLARVRISDILADVLAAVRAHHVRMEADFVNTVIAVLLLEGIGRQMDPSLDLFKSALPILRQLGRQMAVQEGVAELPRGNLGTMLKIWVWLEARELVSSAFVDADDMVKYDWLVPNV